MFHHYFTTFTSQTGQHQPKHIRQCPSSTEDWRSRWSQGWGWGRRLWGRERWKGRGGSRRIEFGQKTGKWSVFSSYNPKFSILEPKCGPKKIWKFWSHGPPLTPPYPPWHPPGVRGGQKWPKCIPSSPLMIIYAKKAISGGSKKLTYFFTRNVPVLKSIHFRSIVRLHYYWATSLLSGNRINNHFECILTAVAYVQHTV